MEKSYKVQGMTCVICKKNVENALNSVPFINTAIVNLIENEVTITFDEKEFKEDEIFKAVSDAGYKLENIKNTNNNSQLVLLIVSATLTLILMIISMNRSLILLQFILSFFVILINNNIYKSGFKSLFKLNPNMFSLVSLSSFISFVYSLFAAYKISKGYTNYHLFFESSSMVLVIVSIGKYIESRTKLKTISSIRGLTTLIPMQANLLKDGEEIIIPINEVKKNDFLLVKPGESIPQDGIVISGTSSADESMITGESFPVNKSINDEVIGGTININGMLTIKVTKLTSTTVLSNIINLTKKATMDKLPIERISDKVSKYFVSSVIIISLLTFIIWFLLSKDLEKALNFALSVLVISCPCALGLATPSAIATAINNAATNGILIKNGEILEVAGKTKTIIFDKTGTLTENKLNIVSHKEYNSEFINVLSSIEKTSNHPISKTILNKYPNGELTFDSSEFVAGEGIIAKINDDVYKVGNSKLIGNINKDDIEFADINNYSYVAATKNDKLLGIVYIADVIRETSKSAINNLIKRGIKPIMCTGDNDIAAKSVANKLNINEYMSYVKPEDKSSLVLKNKENGVVMMVGDGVNDAIALTSADVSVSIKSASDMASSTSDVILMKNDLNDISYLYDLANKTMRIIRQNLFWALGYNSVLIPIAAGVFYNSLNIVLNPMIASSAMWISSMFVILNALRINNIKRRK